MKPVHFVGTSREDLRELPDSAQETAGFQLFKVQQGKEPDDWKPMPSVGAGVQEIRVRDERGAYRVFYVAKFEEAVYVLRVFQKRSQKTARGLLKKSASGVLASFRPSTYPGGYASALRSLRPSWTAILNSLCAMREPSVPSCNRPSPQY